MSEQSVDVKSTTSVGIAVNVAAGHVGEMVGASVQAAAKAVGCSTGESVGKAIESAGKAWGNTAMKSGSRDAARMSGKE